MKGRASRNAARPGPLPSHQLPVPPQEGLGPNQERPPRLSPKHPARRGEERPVGCAVDRTLHLSAQDRDLVSQHGDLEFRLGRHAVVRTDQTEDPAQEEIEERADHGAAFSQTGRRCRSQHAIVFLDPTGVDDVCRERQALLRC
jgi:hypothetical protein